MSISKKEAISLFNREIKRLKGNKFEGRKHGDIVQAYKVEYPTIDDNSFYLYLVSYRLELSNQTKNSGTWFPTGKKSLVVKGKGSEVLRSLKNIS